MSLRYSGCSIMEDQTNGSSIESLEARRMLAGDFAGVNKAGVLTLLGTPGEDHYVVSTTRLESGRYTVNVDRDGEVIVFDPGKVIRVRFDGGAGNDYVEVEQNVSCGNCTLFGGEGNDTLMGGELFDQIHGGPGADLLKGGNQRDTVYGDGGKDRIFGNAYNDVLYGGAGDDKINGGPGDDTIDGGRGNDTLSSSGGNDTVFGGAGMDTGLDLDGLITPADGVEKV
jgi:Ca2+-binding RTX toxin-like protein